MQRPFTAACPRPSVTGTNSADTIYGSNNGDNINARAGNDTVHGRAGDDQILGGTGADKLNGNTGNDVVFPAKLKSTQNGQATFDNSNDTVWGGMGDDPQLYGGFGQGGHDTVHGGKGDDTIYVSQRMFKPGGVQTSVTKETVDYGPGTDTVYYDQGKDKVSSNCENQIPVPAGGNVPVQQQGVAAQNALGQMEKVAQ